MIYLAIWQFHMHRICAQVILRLLIHSKMGNRQLGDTALRPDHDSPCICDTASDVTASFHMIIVDKRCREEVFSQIRV